MWFTYWLLVHRLCSATLDSCNLPFGLAHLYSRAFLSVRCCQRTWYVMGKTFDFSDHVVRDDFAGKPFYVPSKILSHSARRLIQMIVSILLFTSPCSFQWKKKIDSENFLRIGNTEAVRARLVEWAKSTAFSKMFIFAVKGMVTSSILLTISTTVADLDGHILNTIVEPNAMVDVLEVEPPVR